MFLKQISQLALFVGAGSFIMRYATSGNMDYLQSALLSIILAILLDNDNGG